MSEALRELELVQVGMESVPGTAVAADMVLLGTGMEWAEDQGRIVLEEPRGVLANYETQDLRFGVGFQYEGYLDYEQVLLPLLTGIEGGVTGVDQDSGGPYLWEFDPTLTAADGVDSATIEYVEDDGTTEHIEREAAYLTCSEFEIDIPLNGLAMLRATYFARQSKSSTVTASLSPLSRALIPGELFTCAIDDTYAGIGGTAFGGHIRQATLRVNTGISPKYSLKGRTDLDFTGHNRAKITGSLTLRVELDSNAGDSGEVGDWRSGNLRFVRLKATNGTKVAQFDVVVKWIQAPRISFDGSTKVVELVGELMYDPTGTKVFLASITNQLSAF